MSCLLAWCFHVAFALLCALHARRRDTFVFFFFFDVLCDAADVNVCSPSHSCVSAPLLAMLVTGTCRRVHAGVYVFPRCVSRPCAPVSTRAMVPGLHRRWRGCRRACTTARHGSDAWVRRGEGEGGGAGVAVGSCSLLPLALPLLTPSPRLVTVFSLCVRVCLAFLFRLCGRACCGACVSAARTLAFSLSAALLLLLARSSAVQHTPHVLPCLLSSSLKHRDATPPL